MRFHMKLAAALFAVFFAGPALAKAPPSWSGCHVGFHGGYAMASSDTTFAAPGAPIALAVDGLSSHGAEIGANAGCDLQLTGTPFVVGGWGEWTWRDLDHTTTLTLGPNIARASFGIDQAWAIGGRAGVAHENALLYVLVGYTQAESSPLLVSMNGTALGSFGLGTLQGWVFGGGMEVRLEHGWALRGEYRQVRYDGTGAELIPGTLAVDMDTTEHVARLGAVYRFGH